MTEKKYLDWAGLVKYDGKIKGVISAGDAATLKAAKDHADDLASNYDAAGSAASAQAAAEAAAKSYTDGKVTELNGTIAGVKTTAEKGVADAATAQAAADAAQDEVDALEAYVGTFTASEGVDTVVKYIDAKTANIASSDTVSALDARVTQAEKDIDAIETDYLKAADKTELQGKINTAQDSADAVQAEMDAFKLAAEVGDAAVDTLKEIQNYITTDGEAAKAMTESIAANAKAIEDEVARATKAEGDIETAYKAADTAQVERIAALEAKFTGEGSVADQIADAVAAEAELRAAGDAAAEDSAAAALKAAQDAQVEVDALEGVVATLTQTVGTKAAQADLDALAGRVTTAEGEIDDLQADTHTHDNKATLDAITATVKAGYDDAVIKAHTHANADVLNDLTAQLVSNWNAAEGNAKAYTDEKIAEFVAIKTGEIDSLFA